MNGRIRARRRATIAAAALLASLLEPQVAHAAAPEFPDAFGEVAAAPVVVVGTAAGTTVRQDPSGRIVSETTFQVERRERGRTAREIVVRYFGGTVGDLSFHVENGVAFHAGQRSRLFLRELGGSRYAVVHGSLGKQDSGPAPDDPVHQPTPDDASPSTAAAVGSCDRDSDYPQNGWCWSRTKIFDADLPFDFFVNSNTPDITGEETAVDLGYGVWEQSLSSRADFANSGSTSIASTTLDGVNAVYWTNLPVPCGEDDPEIVPTQLACASWWTLNAHGLTKTIECDVEFNDNYTWRNGAVAGAFDVQSVATHEAGHCLGQAHHSDSAQIMYPTFSAGTTKRALGSGDHAGNDELYPTDFHVGDGTGFYRLSGGSWHLRNDLNPGSSNYAWVGVSPSEAPQPVAGDWDGNGADSVGWFRASDASWHLKNALGPGSSDYAFVYGGTAGSVITPVTGDWDGDGDTTIGWFRPADASWHLRNTNSNGPTSHAFVYGSTAGDVIVPVTGDWDGDGDTTIGWYRASDRSWHLRNSNSGGASSYAFVWGPQGGECHPVTGDWDGSGTTGVGMFCPADGTWFLRNSMSNGPTQFAFARGGTDDLPVAGDWNGI